MKAAKHVVVSIFKILQAQRRLWQKKRGRELIFEPLGDLGLLKLWGPRSQNS